MFAGVMAMLMHAHPIETDLVAISMSHPIFRYGSMSFLGPGLFLLRPWSPVREVESSSALSIVRLILLSLSHSCHVLLTHVMCGTARSAHVNGGDHANSHDDDDHD